MFNIGPGEFALIALAALLVFGPDRIPSLARSLARGYREIVKLKRQVGSSVDEIKKELDIDLDVDEEVRGAGLQEAAQLLRDPLGERVDRAGQVSSAPDLSSRPQSLLEIPPEDDYLGPASPQGGRNGG